MVGRIDQRDSRLIAVFRLTRHVANRLVYQDGDLLHLGRVRGGRDFNVLVGTNLGAERIDDFAVDQNPAFFDPFIGFAARAQAELRHHLRQAHEPFFIFACDAGG